MVPWSPATSARMDQWFYCNDSTIRHECGNCNFRLPEVQCPCLVTLTSFMLKCRRSPPDAKSLLICDFVWFPLTSVPDFLFDLYQGGGAVGWLCPPSLECIHWTEKNPLHRHMSLWSRNLFAVNAPTPAITHKADINNIYFLVSKKGASVKFIL